ncbi:MAG TPA: YibE/F family protein [Sporosarcina sp.]|nr:YibE/F family protein [Sporosarcina sp.]
MKPFSKKTAIVIYSVIGLFLIATLIFTLHNESFYKRTIGKITAVQVVEEESIQDAYGNEDLRTSQQLTVQILNGAYKGEQLQIDNSYTKSGAYDEAYRQGQKVFVGIHERESVLEGEVVDAKRDSYFVLIVSFFVIVLLIVGNKQGLFSIISFLVNAFILSLALDLYVAYPSISLVVICGIAALFFSTFSLLLVNGRNVKTYTAIISTLLGTIASLTIAFIAIKLTNGNGLRYEEMQFITRPYEMVFLASLFVGSLGAVMDIAITMTASLFEIFEKNHDISLAQLKASGMNIGKDVMGTMTSILFFVYVSGSLPMLILYLKNGASLNFALSINLSLELARALAGGIGVVLTIPIGLYTALFFIRRKKKVSA